MSAVLDEILEKRSALVARKRELKTELTRLAADISAIDRVVLMLDPGHEARVPPSAARSSPACIREAN